MQRTTDEESTLSDTRLGPVRELSTVRQCRLCGKRNHLRVKKLTVARDQGNILYHTCRGDNLVGGVASDIQIGALATDFQRQRPGVDTSQSSFDLGLFEFDIDPAELHKFGELPQNNGGDAPGMPRKKRLLFFVECSSEGKDQNVSVKIQHSISPR